MRFSSVAVQPLSGAEVIVVTVGEGIHISGGKTYQRGYHPSALTDPDGRFSFSPPDNPYRIIVLHDQGYGEASPQQLLKGLQAAWTLRMEKNGRSKSSRGPRKKPR